MNDDATHACCACFTHNNLPCCNAGHALSAEPTPEHIAALVAASPNIRPEVLRLVPGCIKLVDAYRRTWIDNGGLREDDPLNKAIGVLTIAAGWAAAPLEGGGT